MRAQAWIIVAVVLLLLVGGGVVYTMTRGLRNNNPGNLRRTSDQWQGLAPVQTDPDYFQFVRPEDGIRAMAVTLRNYRAGGRNTIRKIITRWAPPTENNTPAYVTSVSNYAGIDPDQQLVDSDMLVVIAGIINHENGVMPYDYALIDSGIALA
jgi:hypothetical protein